VTLGWWLYHSSSASSSMASSVPMSPPLCLL
jgi:hypothetical protein